MGYVNDRWMSKPESLLEAKGLLGGPPPNGGLSNPQETVVNVTVMLVRFGGKEFEPVTADGKRPPLHGAHGLFGSARYGGWWMAFEEYGKIETFASQRRLPVNVAVRHLCFVPREWSDLGTLIQGKLAMPMRAWSGVGRPVTGRDSMGHRRTYPARQNPAEQVVQLFIPGLCDYDLNRSVFQPRYAGFLPMASD